LEPMIRNNPKGTWESWVHQAYVERIGLSATGFYKSPIIGYDFETKSGEPFRYYTPGVACAEVEIDCLTGDHKVLRVDIVMDVGESLNPAIDIGQIEGAFIQGYGLFTLEEQKYTASGNLLSKGPGMYKIPSVNDVPREFNVCLLKGSPNKVESVHSSRAIGEPPLFLGSSIFFAIKDAIKAKRLDSGINGPFTVNSPLTSETIRLACEDGFVKKVKSPEPGTFRPWTIKL